MLYTMGSRLFVFFQPDCSQLCNRDNQFKKKTDKFLCDKFLFNFFLTWLGLTNILIYSFWTYWLRDVVSHFMWMQKKKKFVHGQSAPDLNCNTVVLVFDLEKYSYNWFPMFLK